MIYSRWLGPEAGFSSGFSEIPYSSVIWHLIGYRKKEFIKLTIIFQK
jgi:hypothetical protein